MSIVIGTVDLTLFGCPMHYIKAREALYSIEQNKQVLLRVNSGDPVKEILKSLRQDGQLCEIESEDILTTTIKVTKKYDRN